MSLPVRLCQQEWISASRIDTVSLQFFFSPTIYETRSEENPEQQKYSFSLLTIRRRGTWALIWWTGTTHVPPFRSRSFEFLWLSPATNKKKKEKSWSSRPFHDSITQWASRTLPTTTSYLSVLVNTNFIQRKQKRKQKENKKKDQLQNIWLSWAYELHPAGRKEWLETRDLPSRR